MSRLEPLLEPFEPDLPSRSNESGRQIAGTRLRRESSASTQASIRLVLQANGASPFTFCASAISHLPAVKLELVNRRDRGPADSAWTRVVPPMFPPCFLTSLGRSSRAALRRRARTLVLRSGGKAAAVGVVAEGG